MRPCACVVVLGWPGVLLWVHAVTGGDALELLGAAGDGVLLWVIPLPADNLRQNSTAGIDEPVTNLQPRKNI